MHGAQHVRAVGALLAAGLGQAARLEALQHRVQQQVLSPTCNKTGAELRQHAEVEPGVGQLQGMLPIDAAANGVGGLPVAELLEELEHRDQRQAQGARPGWPRVG